MNKLVAWVDGSVYPNPGGSGGAAAILVYGDSIRIEGRFIPAPTTCNRSEALALKLALSCLQTNMPITVVSDSQYCGTCTRKILNTNKLPEKNIDLWRGMSGLLRRPLWLKIQHMHGHEGEPLNEVCDLIAGVCRRTESDMSFRVTGLQGLLEWYDQTFTKEQKRGAKKTKKLFDVLSYRSSETGYIT